MASVEAGGLDVEPNVFYFRSFLPFDELGLHIVLGSSEEDGCLVGNLTEPSAVDVGLVEAADAVQSDCKLFPGNDNRMALAVRHIQKDRQFPGMVDSEMKSEGSFAGAEHGTGEHGEAQVDNRDVNAVERIPEHVLGCQVAGAAQECVESGLRIDMRVVNWFQSHSVR